MNNKESSLNELGYSKEQIKDLQKIDKDNNNVVISGIVGSFKSSTLKSLLQKS